MVRRWGNMAGTLLLIGLAALGMHVFRGGVVLPIAGETSVMWDEIRRVCPPDHVFTVRFGETVLAVSAASVGSVSVPADSGFSFSGHSLAACPAGTMRPNLLVLIPRDAEERRVLPRSILLRDARRAEDAPREPLPPIPEQRRELPDGSTIEVVTGRPPYVLHTPESEHAYYRVQYPGADEYVVGCSLVSEFPDSRHTRHAKVRECNTSYRLGPDLIAGYTVRPGDGSVAEPDGLAALDRRVRAWIAALAR